MQTLQGCIVSITGYKGKVIPAIPTSRVSALDLLLHGFNHPYSFNHRYIFIHRYSFWPTRADSYICIDSDNSVANAQQVCSYNVEYNPSTNIGNQQMTYSGQFPSTCRVLQFLVFTFTIQPQTVNPLQERLGLGINDVNLNIYKC